MYQMARQPVFNNNESPKTEYEAMVTSSTRILSPNSRRRDSGKILKIWMSCMQAVTLISSLLHHFQSCHSYVGWQRLICRWQLSMQSYALFVDLGPSSFFWDQGLDAAKVLSWLRVLAQDVRHLESHIVCSKSLGVLHLDDENAREQLGQAYFSNLWGDRHFSENICDPQSMRHAKEMHVETSYTRNKPPLAPKTWSAPTCCTKPNWDSSSCPKGDAKFWQIRSISCHSRILRLAKFIIQNHPMVLLDGLGPLGWPQGVSRLMGRFQNSRIKNLTNTLDIHTPWFLIAK